MYYLSMMIVIGSSIFYHVSSKSITKTLHPILSMMVTYSTALVLTGLLFLVFPLDKNAMAQELKSVNWACFLLGAAAVGLEAGYMFVYRSGWDISVASVYSNVAVMVLLIPMGVYFFKDRLNLNTAAGVLLCVVGIFLINRK